MKKGETVTIMGCTTHPDGSYEINEVITNEEKTHYQILVDTWKGAKEVEKAANNDRLYIEKQLLELLGTELSEKGANNFPNGLKVTTGLTESWDQYLLRYLREDWENGELDLPFFPFDIVCKPNARKIAALRETMGSKFTSIFSDALTIKPKKPAFEVKEQTNGNE